MSVVRFPASRSLPVLAWLALALLVAPGSASAAPPVPPSDLDSAYVPQTGPRGGGPVEWPTGRINYLFEMDQIAAFLDAWQVKDPGSPDFGGMIEAEAGPLGAVIQTDNTLEAIWFWSRYTFVTGRTTYLQNIADAWIYCENYPPWLEEGPVNGYYRAHNCAWALTAESAYRAATGDPAKMAYAETAADWMAARPLFINGNQRLNALVQGWTAGNLYLYGEEMGRGDWMSTAVTFGNAVWNDYIAIDPPTNLATEQWAMSSGTMVWGLCSSVFRDDPVAGAAWIATYGALVDTFQTWYDVANDSYDWDNSWNVAYANAHFAMTDVSGDPQWADWGVKLTNQLLSYDEDDDGGIQATTQDPVTEDMSWVTSYLGKFGVDRMVGDPPGIDAGVLRFVSPADGAVYLLGDPIAFQVEVSNFGLQDLTGVEVLLEGPFSESATVDLPFVARETLDLHPGWTPPGPGRYDFVCLVGAPGDENASNDALAITVYVEDPADAPEGPSDGPSASASGRLFLGPPVPNPASDAVAWSLGIPEGLAARVAIVRPDGRQVDGWSWPAGPARVERTTWDRRDRAGREVAAGLYYLRVVAGDREEVRSITIVP